jgi:hypothetical protein
LRWCYRVKVNRFLQQAANDPRIGGDRLFRQGVGIDLAGQPLLGFAKYIAHDITGNLICN